MSVHIQTRRHGHLLEIRLARPDKRNAITAPMYAALADALVQAENDSSVRAVVLLGGDGCFTAGNDLTDLLESPPTASDAPVFAFLDALARTTVPIVAGVDGDAVGIGTTMLLHCDLVLATPRARLRLPFVELGFVPEAGSTHLLPRLIGHARAAELMLLADFLDAARACELGIVNRLVEPERLEEEVRAMAEAIAAKPPRAVRATKRLLKQNAGRLEDAMRAEALTFAEHMISAEAREAFRAFLEKRKPDFTGLF